MKTTRFLILSLFILTFSTDCFGQTASTASIVGEVTDANGAVVAKAAVKLVDKATGAEKTTATDSAGRYVFAAVEPGSYDLTVTAQGFRTAVTTGVKAEVTKVATIDVSLQIGGAAEQVTVTAVGEAQLQTADSAVGNVIDADRIKRLPTANRQATDLLRLQPLVAPGGEVSGSRADQNTYTLDGIDVTDQVGFRGAFFTVVPTPTESVEEFRSTVANPNATFGRSAGAQTTLVTKRGRNSLFGSVYEYHQNDNLNANSWTNNQRGVAKPPLIENRFGFSLGGPIWKDKVFFFGNYEGRRVPGSTTVTRVVPTQSFRDGQLRFRDSAGNVVTIDPKTFDSRGLGANPAILAYLKKLPLPNASGFGDGLNTGGFSANIPTTTREDYGVLRLDYQVNENWSFEAKGALFRSIQSGANQVNLLDLAAGADTTQRPKNLTFGLTGTIGSNFVNEARIGHSFDDFVLKVITPTGAPSGFNIAVNLAQTPSDNNPALALLDEAIDVDTQRAREQSLGGGTWQFIDNATWTKGAHTVQFGGNMRRISTFHFRNDKVIGSVAFPVADIGTAGNTPVAATERPQTCNLTATPAITTNCLQASDVNRYNQYYKSLLGIVDNVSYLAVRDADLKPTPIGTGLINNAVLRHWEFYAGDIWKLRPNLTVSYGLRYQWHTPPIDELDRQTLLAYKDTGQLIDPQDYLKQKAAAAANGDIFNPDISYLPIKNAPQDGVFRINRKDFSPRASVAWEPRFKGGPFGFLFGENKSALRGGYSLIYDRVNTISSVVVPMLGVGFAQTLSVIRPLNSAGLPFRAGVDGAIPVPVNTAVTAPVVPAKPFGETLSFTMDPGIEDPYNHAVNFSIQRELPGRMLLEVSYVGRFARNLYQNVNLNSAPIFFKDKASGQTFAQAFDAVAAQLRGGVKPEAVTSQPWFQNQLGAALGPTATQVLAAQQTAGFTGGNINNLWNTFIDFVAPRSFNNQQSLDLFVRTSLGRSNYNAMAITLHQRLARGLTFDVNYTLGKSLDQIGLIQNNVGQFSSSFDGDIDYGPSDFDFRHIFNANGVYDLPFGKGRFSAGKYLNKVIGGWHVSGIYQAFSGAPLTVVQGTQVYGAGLIFGASTGAIPTGRLDIDNSVKSGVSGSGGVGASGNPATKGTGLNLFSDPEKVSKSFRSIQLAADGRQGRGALRGPSRWQFDLSVGKTTTIYERIKFGLQFDFFNVFNKVNFADPTLDLRNPATFGVITTQLIASGLRPRAIQIGARLEF
ncbi:MAG TPA: carboxypeptidase regulatory-like domain-containing protein [Blastocatellia bacterium]|nr:carboxypeptidase regulatory-like domain-containing protein [Blastocatellia bacterium]